MAAPTWRDNPNIFVTESPAQTVISIKYSDERIIIRGGFTYLGAIGVEFADFAKISSDSDVMVEKLIANRLAERKTARTYTDFLREVPDPVIAVQQKAGGTVTKAVDDINLNMYFAADSMRAVAMYKAFCELINLQRSGEAGLNRPADLPLISVPPTTTFGALPVRILDPDHAAPVAGAAVVMAPAEDGDVAPAEQAAPAPAPAPVHATRDADLAELYLVYSPAATLLARTEAYRHFQDKLNQLDANNHMRYMSLPKYEERLLKINGVTKVLKGNRWYYNAVALLKP